MPLPNSGLISIDMIATELSIPNTNLELGDTRLRTLAGIPSGLISLSDFYGKSAGGVGISGASFALTLLPQKLSTTRDFIGWNSLLYNKQEFFDTKAGSASIGESSNSNGALITANDYSRYHQITDDIFLQYINFNKPLNELQFSFCRRGENNDKGANSWIRYIRIRPIGNGTNQFMVKQPNKWLTFGVGTRNRVALPFSEQAISIPINGMPAVDVPISCIVDIACSLDDTTKLKYLNSNIPTPPVKPVVIPSLIPLPVPLLETADYPSGYIIEMTGAAVGSNKYGYHKRFGTGLYDRAMSSIGIPDSGGTFKCQNLYSYALSTNHILEVVKTATERNSGGIIACYTDNSAITTNIVIAGSHTITRATLRAADLVSAVYNAQRVDMAKVETKETSSGSGVFYTVLSFNTTAFSNKLRFAELYMCNDALQ